MSHQDTSPKEKAKALSRRAFVKHAVATTADTVVPAHPGRNSYYWAQGMERPADRSQQAFAGEPRTSSSI